MNQAEVVSSSVPMSERPTFPYEITFVDCSPSPAVQAKIEKHLAKIERLHHRIIASEVIVRIPHKHGHQRYFHIHIQLDIPGQRIVVSREPEADETHTDVYVAVRDAFTRLTRKLEHFLKQKKDRRARFHQAPELEDNDYP